MKSPLIAALLLSVLLAACGQAGPLVLPDSSRPAAPEAPQPQEQQKNKDK